MKITWDKLTKPQWDKACAAACEAARVEEVPAALVAARAAKEKKK